MPLWHHAKPCGRGDGGGLVDSFQLLSTSEAAEWRELPKHMASHCRPGEMLLFFSRIQNMSGMSQGTPNTRRLVQLGCLLDDL